MIILDFCKAFDKVPHQRLFRLKLQQFGIRDNVLGWIQRSQQVVLLGTKSDEVPVTSSVPQGTVLGPLLFLVYINDIANNFDSHMRLFADDCLLYRVISNVDDCAKLQRGITHFFALWLGKYMANVL